MSHIPKPGKYSQEELTQLLTLPAYPRSATYDAQWMLENRMGPNALWLAEGLSQAMELQPGMRVLDMGCGRAISSIFLAREFDVQVWATDLWIGASDNWERICEAGVQDSVFPIHAEAHALPFAHGFFDTLVSLDAYHYFGTDDLYMGTFAHFVRPGGQIGIVVPGLRHEFTNGLPDHLVSRWPWDWWSFHSPDWWCRHWEKTGLVDVEVADMIPDGWKDWLTWEEIASEQGYPASQEEIDVLREDAGRNLGFTRLVARRK
jgi:cyclopropane fatty-acyl-phospholipid synthase-like methyltransferase